MGRHRKLKKSLHKRIAAVIRELWDWFNGR
jgi:hypothetical protein